MNDPTTITQGAVIVIPTIPPGGIVLAIRRADDPAIRAGMGGGLLIVQNTGNPGDTVDGGTPDQEPGDNHDGGNP